jgi:hypothetical protein
MQVLDLDDRLLKMIDLVALQRKQCPLQLEGLPHLPRDCRLLTNVPNIKEAIQLRMHTSHMHAHLALLMLAVVTACCKETSRGRSKLALVLRIWMRFIIDDVVLIDDVVDVPRPRRIGHFILDVCLMLLLVWAMHISWRCFDWHINVTSILGGGRVLSWSCCDWRMRGIAAG